MNQNTKMLLGALVAAGLAIAVYYGLISQQTASGIQSQANQTLGTTPVSQQGTAQPGAQRPVAPTQPDTPATAPATPVPQGQTSPR